MAGTCYGDGLTIDSLGRLALDGPRSLSWPGSGTCLIDAANGIRTDPVTGKLWVPPDAYAASQSAASENITVNPTATGLRDLTSQTLTMTARSCREVLYACHVVGGYLQIRQGTGNFWTIEREFRILVDGVTVLTLGWQSIAAAENNSGGATTQGGPPENSLFHREELPPDSVIRFEAAWRLNVLTYLANGVNSVVWRSPRLEGTLIGYPV